MPHTAKFSKQFYDRLGDQVVNELVDWLNTVDLTYKTELRDLNEVNFQRFDATLKAEVAHLDQKIEVQAARLDKKIAVEVARLEQRIGVEMAKLRTDLFRWMFGFWVGNLAVTVMLVVALTGR